MKKKLIAILMTAAMCICFCACGNDNGSTEETVEITTVPAEEQQDEEEDSISVYHEIYNEYAPKMDDVAKDGGKIEALDKIFEEGKSKMSDAMLSSTDDDQDIYEKWFAKLSEKYNEVAREIM